MVKSINDVPVTKTIFVDNYWPIRHPRPWTEWICMGQNTMMTSGSTKSPEITSGIFNSLIAMNELGKLENQEIIGK